jgi:hypothetical protein
MCGDRSTLVKVEIVYFVLDRMFAAHRLGVL